MQTSPLRRLMIVFIIVLVLVLEPQLRTQRKLLVGAHEEPDDKPAHDDEYDYN